MKIIKRNKQELIGLIVSDKMDKSIVVRVERFVLHSVYKKFVRRYKKYHAHDENNECRMGDIVRIIETRPLSKLKHFRVAEIIKRNI
ncbi:MAG: 30S ribosomal protein S17 [Bacteroidetes bacterium]|jgi:small subunit ribosomal protein S17|nr:30S ribosomal protein S17 [Bacteroidota bacterium]